MTHSPTQLILDALSRAMGDPVGVPLFGNRKAPGLFGNGVPSRQAARHCKDEGLLQVVRTVSKGKTVLEYCALTEKGVTYLIEQVSPKGALKDLIRHLETRSSKLEELITGVRLSQQSLDGLKGLAQKVLEQIAIQMPIAPSSANGAGIELGKCDFLTYLSAWRSARPTDDCPLPELFRQGQAATPTLSIGRFHDALRWLHETDKVYLHPWTGPLSEIPEPAYALLIGHEIAYYASLRQ